MTQTPNPTPDTENYLAAFLARTDKELRELAARHEIPGRSRMRKADLAAALAANFAEYHAERTKVLVIGNSDDMLTAARALETRKPAPQFGIKLQDGLSPALRDLQMAAYTWTPKPRTVLISSRRVLHAGRPCNACPGATYFEALRGSATPTGRTFVVGAGHGQAPRPTATQKQPGRRYGPAPKRLTLALAS